VVYHGSTNASLTSCFGIAENIAIDSVGSVESSKKVKLVSSSLSGIFPSGLTIGKISDIKGVKSGAFASATVELDSNFLNRLHEVTVLIKR
jgi:cell shape-determining protein MreC